MGYIRNKPIPIELINKAIKSICKIKVKAEYEGYCTGFFIRFFSQKYLITCNQIIHYNVQKKNLEIEVEIFNKKLIKIGFNDRFIKYLEKPKNILAIEIKDSDFICKDIEFLECNMRYIEGYSIYKDFDAFSLYYGVEGIDNGAACSSGRIENIYDYEFEHSISTGKGSSGSPIILFSQSNIMSVIGIHTSYDMRKRLNYGVFIGELINALPKKMYLRKQNLNKNKIFEYNNNSNISEKIYNNLDINKFNDNITNLNINNNLNFNSLNNNKPINLNLNLTKNEKKDIINFSIKSTDQSFNSNIFGRSKDRFNTIMNIIIEKEPSVAEKIGYFLCKGNKVNEYKSIKDNGIKNNDIVLMNIGD